MPDALTMRVLLQTSVSFDIGNENISLTAAVHLALRVRTAAPTCCDKRCPEWGWRGPCFTQPFRVGYNGFWRT